MNLLKINGVIQKTPSKLNVVVSDVDANSTRNAKGDLIRDRVAVKRKLEIEFPPLDATEMQTLLNAVADVFFTVTYYDPILGETTLTMYVGDRKSDLYKFGQGGTDILYNSFSMNFIER